VKLDVSTCLGRIKNELLRVQEILAEKK
jgi:hypothetical protein